jgi:hypothetical protein
MTSGRARCHGIVLGVALLAVHTSAAQSGRDSSALTLDLNLPAFRLELRDSGRVIRNIRVAVGRPSFPTPIGRYTVDYLIWNPSWTPPNKPWARNERPQSPGPDNWMGRVKMHVVDLVFLHGSPFTNSFGTAASHACVRMANNEAIALARTLSVRAGASATPALLDSLIADERRTYQMPLRPGIPITLRYDLAELRHDSLFILPDIYPRAPGDARSQSLDLLLSFGIDSVRVDLPKLEALIRRGRHKPAAALLTSILHELPRGSR